MLSFSPLPKYPATEFDSQVFCVKADSENKYYIAGLSNGQIALISSTTGRLSYTLQHSPEELPVTSLHFNPVNQKLFIAASAEGTISEYSTKTSQVKPTWTIKEEKNEIYAMDITKDSKIIATGGQDKVVRLYDYETQKLKSKLYKIDDDEASNGHTNRIYSVLFHPTEQNILLTAGWDDTIQIWDIRMRQSIHHIFGPHVCSDSIDACGNLILAGSMRSVNQLQLFDFRNYEEIANVKWSKQKEERQCLIYTCKFYKDGEYFIAGGSGDTKVRAFSTKNFTAAGKSAVFSSPIYSLSITPSGENVVIGTQDGHVITHGIQFTRP